jgi:hypothetical protein
MKKILTIIVLISMFSSCDSFIEEDIRSEMSYEKYFDSEDDIVRVANGMYGNLIIWGWNGEGLYFNNMWVLQEIASDNCDEFGVDFNMLDIDKYEFTSENLVFKFIWDQAFLVINNANTVLAEAPKITKYSSEAAKNHILGEAHFIRGMMYFELVKLFGDIPLYNTPTKSIEASKIARTPVVDVYKQIVEDLKSAETLLTVNPFNDRQKGIPNTKAASALLGKVYLTRAALTNNKNDYILARDVLAKVKGKYELTNNFEDIFKVANSNSGESIWAINFSGTNGEGWFTNQFTVRLMPTMKAENGTKNGQAWERPTDKLLNSFLPNDKRYNATFLNKFGEETFADTYIQKYWDREAEGGRANGESDVDFIYLRYADVLLMYAEAVNEINNGPNSDAYGAIEEVRGRAGIGDLPDNMNYQDFKNAILQERQWEFVAEGQRWSDLIRFGKLKEEVSAAKPDVQIKDHHLLFPIPFKERALNPKLTQNTGYEKN